MHCHACMHGLGRYGSYKSQMSRYFSIIIKEVAQAEYHTQKFKLRFGTEHVIVSLSDSNPT